MVQVEPQVKLVYPATQVIEVYQVTQVERVPLVSVALVVWEATQVMLATQEQEAQPATRVTQAM